MFICVQNKFLGIFLLHVVGLCFVYKSLPNFDGSIAEMLGVTKNPKNNTVLEASFLDFWKLGSLMIISSLVLITTDYFDHCHLFSR